MSFFNQDEDETVRQTLERVMREKGMWKESKTMHTEIGDFSYYDDDDGNANASTNAANNQSAGGPTGFAANNQSAGGTRDYTVNTESLIGKPSSYFQNNNNAGSWVNNSTRGFGSSTAGWSGNNGDFGGNISSGFNQNTNFGESPSYGTTPTLQNQTSTPWSYNTTQSQTTPTPWNNQTTQTTNFGDTAQPNTSTDMRDIDGYNSAEAQKRAQILRARRNAVNQILMDGMDVLYGMNRTVNGMTFGGLDWLGNKLGYDSQMNNYLQLKTPQERESVQAVG